MKKKKLGDDFWDCGDETMSGDELGRTLDVDNKFYAFVFRFWALNHSISDDAPAVGGVGKNTGRSEKQGDDGG
jgi:hypothetical protein